MIKLKSLSVSLALSAALSAAAILPVLSPAHAAVAKEWLQISDTISYYGEVSGGKPNGRGTMKWSDSKQYSGEFVNGEREGKGKYVNEYTADGESHKVVYNGEWKRDRMHGTGTLIHKVIQEDGAVRSNEIQTGAFSSGVQTSGYDVIHALADPDFYFAYKSPQEQLVIMGSAGHLKASLKSGSLFSAEYRSGKIHKSYSVFPADTAAEQRLNEASLKYLQSIQPKLNPHLEQFERLAGQVPLK
ncbi:hypothetical protein FHS19_000896 [Paenibacillus rhizosphaerae]|uniref:MORN repeat-containing protein n=1 Tax=Paenibacillus rhizosphaerae TaxID=297318 RepID=A0A839THY8_9BACL|nr:hypothetical protein [Paenibacillus rhizosphaerae]MBB3126242.1 hypothetical protein [Paenibacillus rhizosphaerae]